MNPNRFPFKLYLVTDEAACMGRDLIKLTEAAVKGGVDLVQLREKRLDQPAFLEKALRLKEILDRYDVPLVINDDLFVAMQCHAAGIHVGNSDISPVNIRKEWPDCSILGYSVEYSHQLRSDNADQSDYLALSPVFATPTKINTVTEWGLNGIHHIRQLTTRPLVAIGGINTGNAASVISAGTDCIAVVTAVLSQPDTEKAAALLRNEIETGLISYETI